MDDAVWRDVPGYEGLYQVSRCGRVRSLERQARGRYGTRTVPAKELAGTVTRRRRTVYLYKRGVGRPFLVYRLVGLAFIPNPLGLPEINHLDGDCSNDRADNLEWSTKRDNLLHAYRTGIKNHAGEGNPRAVLTEADVTRAREIGRTNRTAGIDYAVNRGVARQTAYGAVTGRSWTHLPMP